jgi:hypothetical protein
MVMGDVVVDLAGIGFYHAGSVRGGLLGLSPRVLNRHHR